MSLQKLNSVIGQGLRTLTAAQLALGMQVTEENPMVGIESRAALLNSLGTSLAAYPEVFGQDGRPGNLVGEIGSHYL